jgi:hypothetical protein
MMDPFEARDVARSIEMMRPHRDITVEPVAHREAREWSGVPWHAPAPCRAPPPIFSLVPCTSPPISLYPFFRSYDE